MGRGLSSVSELPQLLQGDLHGDGLSGRYLAPARWRFGSVLADQDQAGGQGCNAYEADDEGSDGASRIRVDRA